MSTNFKEANEILDLVEAVGGTVTAAKADGRVDWLDLPKFVPLLGKAKIALDDSDKIDDEFAESTPDEIVAFAQRAVSVALALVQAVVVNPNKPADLKAAALQAGEVTADELAVEHGAPTKGKQKK